MWTRARVPGLMMVALLIVVTPSITLSYKSESQLETGCDGPATADSGLHALLQAQIVHSNSSCQPEPTSSKPEYPARSAVPLALTGNIAFETDRAISFDVYAKDADGSNLAVPLVASPGNDFTPVWSADGTQMVFASDRDGDFDIYLRTASGEEHNLTQNTADDAHPSWSPAGDRIIFTSNRGGGYFQIYTMRIDGTDVRQVGVVPDNNAVYPRYSPDGSRIAFMRASITEPLCQWNWDVWVMDADGGNQQGVTTFLGGDLYPDWTPNGTEIVYASCRNFLDFDLYAVNPDTGAESQINFWFLSNEWGAIYSPDSEHIAFNTDVDGNIEIYIGPAEGGTVSNFTQNRADDLAASWGNQDAPTTYSISGQVTDQVTDDDSNPVPSVTVSDGKGHTALTGTDGNYKLSGLAAGTYILTPSKGEWTFTPVTLMVSVPPDKTGQDFIGTSSGPPPCVLSKQPILLVPGWSGSAVNLAADDQLHYFRDWLGSDYAENCNLFYVPGLSAEKSTRENAEAIQAALHAAYDTRIALAPAWDGHFDIIGHSYGGINSRAYLESDLYDQDQNDGEKGIHVDNLFTLGTPHGGGGPELPGALWIAFGHAIDPDDWGSLLQLTLPAMASFNAIHSQPDGVCYRLVGGHAFEQDMPWQLRLAYGVLQYIPNDLGVYRLSAHELAYWPWSWWKYKRVLVYSTPDMHGYRDQFGLDQYRSYVHPSHTFDAMIAPYLGAGLGQCVSGSQAQSVLAEATSSPSPVPSVLITSGALVSGTLVGGGFQVNWSDQSVFYLNWPLGDLDLSLTDSDGNLIDPTTVQTDPNAGYFELDTLARTATYVFTNTLVGTWGYTITAANVPYTMPYRLIALPSLPVAVTAQASAWQPQGQPVIISGALTYSATTPLTGAAVQAFISRPDGNLDTLNLYDDGIHNDLAAGDGIYGSNYTGTDGGGYYAVVVQAVGVYQTEPYTRTAETSFSVATGAASLAGQYSDQPRDTNANGLYDWLDIGVQISVPQAGTYTLAADLVADAGSYIGHALLRAGLPTGTHNLILSFDGDDILESSRDGPYTLTNVLLVDDERASLLLDQADDAHVTAAYDHRQFGSVWRICLPVVLRDY